MMATYAIGDVQGCFVSLQKLIEQTRFDPAHDRLWFVGDLVNRGPQSLAVLRFVKSLGPAAITVLGNHDLHLLAVAADCVPSRANDTLQDILAAFDRDELCWWLRHRPLLYRERECVLVHAGFLPQWSVDTAEELAREVEQGLRSEECQTFLRDLYESDARRWSDELAGTERLAVITRALTGLRLCTTDGAMEFSFTGPPDQAPEGFFPWFQIPNRRSRDATIVCGHWAALGVRIEPNLLALDGGCVWGRQLVAIRLEDRQVFRVSCA
jgi:bis(5'-nucleosyl)-tetraphosphatase (symmetrical)